MDVVLITERYAESILLMRKKLCMNLLDLFVPPKKVHTHDEFQFSDKQKENFYKFQSLDLHMYNVRLLISPGSHEPRTTYRLRPSSYWIGLDWADSCVEIAVLRSLYLLSSSLYDPIRKIELTQIF